MISIIGSGLVGSSIAFLCASNGLDDIVLLNYPKKQALGASLDITNTIPIDSDTTISGTDNYSEISDSKIIVITASTGVYLKDRNEFMGAQIDMIRDITKKIKTHCKLPIILIVSNPVDVLTYFFQKEINFPRSKVIGIASTLDSSRFRYILSKKIGNKISEILNVHVFGEHGDSMVPIFSKVKINEKKILDIIDSKQKEEITSEVRDYWKSLRNLDSRSHFGIAKKTFDVIKSILNNHPIYIPASVLLEGEFGEKDVCMGVPVKITPEGAVIQDMKLDESEQELFKKSAQIIRANIQVSR